MGTCYESFIAPAVKSLLKNIRTKQVTIVRHYGTFEITNKDAEAVCTEHPDLHVYYKHFKGSDMIEAFEPFLGAIRDIYENCEKDKTPKEFIAQFPIYPLQRSVFVNFVSRTTYHRAEEVLLDEVAYEKKQMLRSMAVVLTMLSEKYPMFFMIDNLNMAAPSTLALLLKLLEENHGNIYVYGAFNELYSLLPHAVEYWEKLVEKLEDDNCIVTGGGEDVVRMEEVNNYFHFESSLIGEYLVKLNNMYYLLDFEQAEYYLSKIYHKIEVEKLSVDEDSVFELYILYARISIYSNMATALLLCDNLQILPKREKSVQKKFRYYYLLGQVQMYNGNLKAAKECADTCIKLAEDKLSRYDRFKALLLKVMVRMSGWHNIFFCATNIDIPPEFLELTVEYGYENHRAYTYIFAYDNDVDILGKGEEIGENLVYFKKGTELAKEIHNEYLLLTAYRKNIMLSSLFGLFQVTNYYYYKSMEIVGDKEPIKLADIYNGLGYNCCAAEQYEEANSYYNKAIVIYYQLNMMNYVGETLYNMAINCMLAGENEVAYNYLLNCVKIINTLHLNDLRVCNISKIFGLLALCSYRLGRGYDTKVYLDNALQFLGHILNRTAEEERQNLDSSYTACDDDLFLYYYVSALVEMDQGNLKEALNDMEKAGVYIEKSTGYQFFGMVQYEISLAELFGKMGREKEAEEELQKGILYAERCGVSEKKRMLEAARQGEEYHPEHKDVAALMGITLQEIHVATKQAGIIIDYDALKKRMEFITAWQKIIDISGKSYTDLITNALNTFMLNFSIDSMIYIRYKDDKPDVCFDTKQVILSEEDIEKITGYFYKHRSGFVTSKLQKNHMEYNRIVSLFGITQICSMVCLPYYNNEKLNGVFIMYILMKDNWNAPRMKFMLDESDKEFFDLILLQLQNAVEKLENEDQIRSINSRLEKSAITDYLTSLYNRDGFYQKIKGWVDRRITCGITFLYIDLDNFKYYNDTFGHAAGDRILKEVAGILREAAKDCGFAARYGGDEFLISLKFVDRERALSIGRGILSSIKEKKGFVDIITEMSGKDITIPREKELSCSIGIAAMKDMKGDDEIAEAILKADEVLYAIKHSTKGDVKYSD